MQKQSTENIKSDFWLLKLLTTIMAKLLKLLLRQINRVPAKFWLRMALDFSFINNLLLFFGTIMPGDVAKM